MGRGRHAVDPCLREPTGELAIPDAVVAAPDEVERQAVDAHAVFATNNLAIIPDSATARSTASAFG